MRGFSLAEVMLAVALAAVVVLTLVALGLTALTGNQKSGDLSIAQSTAHQLLEVEIYNAQQNSASPLWTANDDANPWKTSQVTQGKEQYTVALYAVDVSDAAVPNLKRCRLRLSWWSGESRQGYGALHTEAVRFASRP